MENSIKNKYCFNPSDGMRGTIVSNILSNIYCNVIWEDGQHCTEKIENLAISNEINPNPEKW